ncbi:DASH complex subunit Duo1 [Golovinomyces cichoracearum]|uniref:DASH complex subunit DUO1 n=1 Tax=Golovinomyces cichoracearum TaxID=62708 RepID=A0A420IBC6_9PEZI|nr:DASH complex subunit Duo1 [Golovinomyces cichoracearum]
MADTEKVDVFEPESNNFPISPSTKITDAYSRGDYDSQFGMEQGKEASLQRELESVRNINEVIEKVLSGLECAQGNMDTVSQTVKSASILLDTWVRILSNTEHNQKLIMNPRWKGASIDIANMEKESSLKAQAEFRRAIEEERQKEESRKNEEEEEERQKHAGTSARSRSTLGSFRGSKLGSTQNSSHFPGRLSNIQSNTRGAQKGRGGSGIGRGLGGSRVRLRGTR